MNINDKSQALRNKVNALRNRELPLIQSNSLTKIAIDLASKEGKTFINTLNGSKFILAAVSNIYSTSSEFIPTAVYKSLTSNLYWSRSVETFIKEFLECNDAL